MANKQRELMGYFVIVLVQYWPFVTVQHNNKKMIEEQGGGRKRNINTSSQQ
jgi:hypothetical protein